MIARKGVADATMQEIADEAGVAKGTVYVYFRDRDELLTKTAARAVERLIERIDVVFSTAGTLEQRLTAIVTSQLEFSDANRDLFHAYNALTQRQGSPARRQRTASFEHYLGRIERLFSEARAAGELRDLDPKLLSVAAAECIRGVIVRRIESEDQTPRDEIIRFIVAFILHGIQV